MKEREEDRQPDDAKPGRKQPHEALTDAEQPTAAVDSRAGLDREVGDLEDPDAEDDGALPGRVGGGLAGG